MGAQPVIGEIPVFCLRYMHFNAEGFLFSSDTVVAGEAETRFLFHLQSGIHEDPDAEGLISAQIGQPRGVGHHHID